MAASPSAHQLEYAYAMQLNARLRSETAEAIGDLHRRAHEAFEAAMTAYGAMRRGEVMHAAGMSRCCAGAGRGADESAEAFASPPVVDREPRWFFSHSRRIRLTGRASKKATVEVDFPLPESTDADDEDAYRTIRRRLLAIADYDAGVLKSAYTPKPWPHALRKKLGRLTGLVVRIASVELGWLERSWERDDIESRVAKQLDATYRTVGGGILEPYRGPALVALRTALEAYAHERDSEQSALRRSA